MNQAMMAAFAAELEKIATEKDAGLGDSVKSFLLKDVGGPKGFLTPIKDAIRNMGQAVAKKAPVVTRRTSGGAFDVSRMAQQMGV